MLLFSLFTFSTDSAAQKVLFLGDSLTAGYGIPQEDAYPSLVGKALVREGLTKSSIVNAGVSGSTSAGGYSRLKWQLKGKKKPAYLVLALGANDGLRGHKPINMQKNLVKIIKLAKANNIRVLLAGMKIPTNFGAQHTKSFEAVFPRVAASEKVAFIPFLLEGVAAIQNLNQADGIHPNQEGHKIMAAHVTKHLLKLIKGTK